MNSQEIFEFIDESVYEKKGERLNDLHRAVIEGILKHQKYEEIADEYGCSPGHAKDVGYELLQLLSEIFGELVSKKNLRSVLIRKGRFNVINSALNKQTSVGNGNMVGYINICNDPPSSKIKPNNVHSQDGYQTDHNVIQKLQQFGLSNEQIAEALNLPIEIIDNITNPSTENHA
jgi:hypothetical protein